MPPPTLMLVKNKGASPLQIFKLLNGTTLDPTQDGNDVSTTMVTLDAGTGATAGDTMNNVMIEAFGKRYLWHRNVIRERDSGGDGSWGVVYTLANTPHKAGQVYSGLHMVFPAGVPTLVGMYVSGTSPYPLRVITTTDGISWNEIATGLDINDGGANVQSGRSIVFENTLYWITGIDFNLGVGSRIGAYNFQTSTFSSWTNTPTQYQRNFLVDFIVHQDKLYQLGLSTTSRTDIFRLDGGSWVNAIGQPINDEAGIAATENNAAPRQAVISDGDDLIAFFTLEAGNAVCRITNPSGTASAVDISSILAIGAGDWVFNKYLDTTNPTAPTWYIWANSGDVNTGTFSCYQFHSRRITYSGLSGSFSVGQTVTGGTSGATGEINEVNGSYLGIINTTGTFQNAETLTTGTGSATSSSTLNETAMTLVGATSLSAANYTLVNIHEGNDRIPAKPAARPQFGDLLPEEAIGGRKRYFRVYGAGADITLSQYHSADQEAPNTLSTLVPGTVAIEDAIDVTGLVGNAAETVLEGLSPSSGDSYVVSATDGDSTLNPGALAIAVGDIVQWNGSAWIQAVANASNFPPAETHATLSSTTALISPYTDGADDGKTTSFDGTSLDGIALTAPSNTSSQITGLTPDNGATQYSYRHNASADSLTEGDVHTVILDVV